jgi:EAL domain-containing protein (putative c-di-GMP-specific phosphodiesterase class I)
MDSEKATSKPNYDSQDALLAHHSAGSISRYVFPEGTTLFQKKESRECAYLIDRGEVHIYGNDEGGEDKLLCVLGEGEIFGETALIDDSPRTATAVTASEAEIFIIPRKALYQRVQGLDPIVSLLISLLIERYRVTRIHLPESIKQDRIGDFIKKISKHEKLPDDVLRIKSTSEAMGVARKELKLEQELKMGLEHKQFTPVLQPILDLKDQSIVGFEALIRWEHPDKGLIMPDDFIPVAERTNVVQHLDRLMLEKACELLPELEKTAQKDNSLFISVNLSGINFGTIDIVRTVKQTIKEAKINPNQIKLEITESALIREPKKAEEALKGLKEIGVSVALDDFGTGYSSLGYLHQFPIDVLKIDRSFVSRLHDSDKSLDIVKAIISLAKTFKLGIVAEGIELEEDVSALKDLSCDMGQGYLFSKPLSVSDTHNFIKEHKQKAA